jgi:hypothetical protein
MAGTSVYFASSAPAAPSVSAHIARRSISPKSARALLVLSHAIEYLTDDFVQEDSSLSAMKPCMDAVRILMELNRQVYSECPEVPSFDERCRGFVSAMLRTKSRMFSATRSVEFMSQRRPAEDL